MAGKGKRAPLSSKIITDLIKSGMDGLEPVEALKIEHHGNLELPLTQLNEVRNQIRDGKKVGVFAR